MSGAKSGALASSIGNDACCVKRDNAFLTRRVLCAMEERFTNFVEAVLFDASTKAKAKSPDDDRRGRTRSACLS